MNIFERRNDWCKLGKTSPERLKSGITLYIGLNATLLGGIKIGDEVLIAPNTFVNQDIPSHSIVVGNPCKVIPKENAADKYLYYKI